MEVARLYPTAIRIASLFDGHRRLTAFGDRCRLIPASTPKLFDKMANAPPSGIGRALKENRANNVFC